MSPQKITPCLWFKFNAQEAVNHYLGIFKNARILETSHYGDAMPELKGKILTIRFELEGQQQQASTICWTWISHSWVPTTQVWLIPAAMLAAMPSALAVAPALSSSRRRVEFCKRLMLK